MTLADLRVPLFVVSTVKDHVAPWRSVYKIHLLTDTDVTFVLTAGGHNAGIVSEPGHPHRSYQVASREDRATGTSTPRPGRPSRPGRRDRGGRPGRVWLEGHSSGPAAAQPRLGAPDRGYPPLGDAPGTYVLQE